jgi:hypothetical protein
MLGTRDRAGLVVLQVTDSTDAPTLQGVIQENVLAGSMVYTDGHTGAGSGCQAAAVENAHAGDLMISHSEPRMLCNSSKSS